MLYRLGGSHSYQYVDRIICHSSHSETDSFKHAAVFVPLPPSKFERSEWFEKREAQDSVNLDFSYARRMSGSGGGVISLGYSSSSGTQSLGSSGGSDGVTNVVNPLSSVQQRRTAHRMPGFGQSDLPAIHPDVLGYSSPVRALYRAVCIRALAYKNFTLPDRHPRLAGQRRQVDDDFQFPPYHSFDDGGGPGRSSGFVDQPRYEKDRKE